LARSTGIIERKRIRLKTWENELAGKSTKILSPGTAERPNKIAIGRMYPNP